MRLPDENKRRLIVEAAMRLFAESPFHEVRLDDVARAAGVGKGTLYIYFKNKEDLYFSSSYDSFAKLVDQLKSELEAKEDEACARIGLIVRRLVEFAIQYRDLYDVARTVGTPDSDSQWGIKRSEFFRLIENEIRRGVESGRFDDPNPSQTALYIPAMIRAIMIHHPTEVDGKVLEEHVLTVLLRGIKKRNGSGETAGSPDH